MKFIKLKARKLKRIQAELSKCSYDTMLEFNKLFPNTAEQYVLQTFALQGMKYYQLRLSAAQPFQDFWSRWNRFKSLRVFL